jgi:hypothetical protein
MPKQPKVSVSRIEARSKVRVLGGPFAGRVGAVTELDGKGGARVTFGPLQAHVELVNLGPAGERGARPAMHSSHRRFGASTAADAPNAQPGEPNAKGGKSGRRARRK